MSGLTDAMWADLTPHMPWNLRRSFANLRVDPHWFPDASGFWYRRETGSGIDYILVDAKTGGKRPAFATDALHRALAAVTTDPLAALARIEVLDRDGMIRLDDRSYHFDGDRLTLRGSRHAPSDGLTSPDGTRSLLRRTGDLWVRDLATGLERPLTDTAQPHFEWAKSPDQSLEAIRLRRLGITLPPIALWAPDSRHVVTYQLDERAVCSLQLVQNIPDDGSLRPILHDLRVAFTGDLNVPMAYQAIIDTQTGVITHQKSKPVHVTETSLIERSEVWWSHDSTRVFYIDHDRYEQRITLVELNAASGHIREIITETSDTFVDVNMEYGRMPNIHILDQTDEAVWFSQRDGWAHLYLIDLGDGRIKAQITKGDWVVRDILGVDSATRQVFFLAGGIGNNDTPYQRSVCAADLDGGSVQVLTPEQGDNNVAMRGVGWSDMVERAALLGPQAQAFAPDCGHFVHTHAPADSLPTSSLRRRDGSLVATLETAQCKTNDLIWPETFQALAADDETPIFAQVWLPDGSHAPATVPVVEMVYPGPQCIEQPLSPFPADPSGFFTAALAGALVRLGMAVVIIDGRGTPFQSKALHDLCHGALDNPGHLEDHAAALAALCKAKPELDPARIAIMGHSAGGHAAARAVLAWPEVWRAAIATAGSHDPRLYNCCWPEKWQGRLIRRDDGSTNYDSVDNSTLAGQLTGSLLLGHGDLDDNVHPAQTQRLAAALIATGKNFEMLITPNDDHYTFPRNPYVVRREIDFLVRQLCTPG